MSPPPCEKVVDALARVQAPLTLSDTCTCPAAPYWPNQPVRRAPAPTGLASWMVTLDTWLPVDTAPPCTQVGADGAEAGVVTCTAVDWGEWSPTAS
jgi:hypothetical protein